MLLAARDGQIGVFSKESLNGSRAETQGSSSSLLLRSVSHITEGAWTREAGVSRVGGLSTGG